jgi:ATP-dependent 26S proteasome regulatory subunit
MKDNNKNFRKIESVVLSGGRCTTLKNDLMHFNTTEQWHLEHGIPYKKSYLFYGPPGTGKTSMIKAISNEFKRHIHLMSLNLIKDDKQLNLLVSKIHMNETIIVIEDIDAMTDVVYDRKERPKTPPPKENEKDKDKSNNNPGITLSGLLNVMDGISNNHGMILVMTSNIPEKLDKALLRPGRIDDKIYFDYCDNITIYNMMKNFYNGSVKQTDKEFSQIKFPEKIAPCKVENIMKKYWNDPEQALETLISGKETELETFTY